MKYNPCKECGKSHGMGIENTLTGDITPIDLCYDCLWKDLKINELKEDIFLENDMQKILKKLENK